MSVLRVFILIIRSNKKIIAEELFLSLSLSLFLNKFSSTSSRIMKKKMQMLHSF